MGEFFTVFIRYLISQWFWFSVFASAYFLGIIVFFEEDLNVNSLVLNGVPLKEALEGQKLIKSYQNITTIILDIVGYIPLFLVSWIPIIHIFFFISVTNIVFYTDVRVIEEERVKKEEETKNKKQEVLDLLNKISDKLETFSEEVKETTSEEKNNSNQHQNNYYSTQKIKKQSNHQNILPEINEDEHEDL